MTNNKVLIVEDSPALARMLSATLNYGKYEVVLASNGHEAMGILEDGNEDIDVIILDLMMPVMDGKEFLIWLRKEIQRDTPVLVYTGSQSGDIEDELLADGANKVVFKPLGASELLEQVKQLLA